MASITENLDKIKTAVYGEEVRTAIHDSIRDCYNDGKAGAVDMIAREQIETQAARIDAIASLEEGSTTGDAELTDIRTGYNGTTYENAGSAVRMQVEDLHDELKDRYAHSASGNPILLKGTGKRAYPNFSLSGSSGSTTVVSCGKNLFRFMHNLVTYTTSGVTFEYDQDAGTITVTSDGARTSTVSGVAMTVNNTGLTAEFKLKFAASRSIVVSGNPSKELDINSKVYFQIVTPSGNYQERGNEGISVLAEAGSEYACRVIVSEGWSGSIVFRPQVEIGTAKTAFEPFSGDAVRYATGSSQVFAPTRNYIYNYGPELSYRIDAAEKSVRVTASDNSAARVVTDRDNTTLNGINIGYISKFTVSEDTTVKITGTPEDYNDIYVEVIDGTHQYRDKGSGKSFVASAGTEYGVRILVDVGASTSADGVKIFPVISTGRGILQSQDGITTIYTDDNARVSVLYYQQSIAEQAEESSEARKGAEELTGFRIYAPFSRLKMRPAQLSFIDDDTTSLALVQRYHADLVSAGAVGSYAVMTRRLTNDPNITAALLDYEREGFGMLYHVQWQQGDSTNYFLNDENRDMERAEANFVDGMRDMATFGFSDWRYWVSPYGVNDVDMQRLAQRHGMKCLISNANNSFIGKNGNATRYNIPRFGFSTASDNTDVLLENLRACIEEHGWMIVTTHTNTWGDDTTVDDRFVSFIQSAKALGVQIASFPEAFNNREPIFYLADLL